MPRLIDLTGKTFGRLTVLRRSTIGALKPWVCICECGTEKSIPSCALISGRTVSCGCQRKDNLRKISRKHGQWGSGAWKSWTGMIRRCTKPECPSYDDYGGRGITVCTQWLSFENFFADMGDRPDGMSLERKEVNGNYEPSNCVWIPMVHQVYNRRVTIRVEIEGCSMALSQACSVLGVDYTRTHSRMRRLGWSFQKAIAEPKKLNGTSYAPMTKPAI